MIDEIVNPRIPEVGERFDGKVVKTTDFGAFVNLPPGNDGLVHISELKKDGQRIDRVEDVVNEGDELEVIVLEVEQGLKMKVGLKPIWEGEEPPTMEEIQAMAAAEGASGAGRAGDRGAVTATVAGRDRGRPPRRDG